MFKQKAKQTDLKNEIRTRILKDTISKINSIDKSCPNSVLILDDKSSQLLTQFVSIPDLSQYGILFVENLKVKRKPFKNMNGIYFINPSIQNFQRINEDFKSISLFFTYNFLRKWFLWVTAYLHNFHNPC
jgi:hypothetical protein